MTCRCHACRTGWTPVEEEGAFTEAELGATLASFEARDAQDHPPGDDQEVCPVVLVQQADEHDPVLVRGDEVADAEAEGGVTF